MAIRLPLRTLPLHRVLSAGPVAKLAPRKRQAYTTPRLLLSHKAFSTSNPISSSSHSRDTMSKFYELKAEKPNGTQFEFSELKEKVVLVVNVASQCGFAKQYAGLQALYDKYKEKDFLIIGFPSNQFGSQEPGTDEEISQFCTVNHGVTFPLMKKSDVNGDNTNEVYKWLKDEKPGLLGMKRVKWNFEKILVNREGKVVNRWASTTTPEQIDKDIAALL